ncbi:MAG: regulatory iron-sulfur-containing complex subunit RicT [bacterium]|nr:regulatory iron-sulfur-containing complex subunit RicT [bacterium]
MDIAGIRLRGVCKTFHFDCSGVALQRGDYVVVQTERGASLGEVIHRIDGHAPKGDKQPFGKVLRVASAEDMRAHQENARREAEAETFCTARIAERGLPMKLVRSEYLLDRSKAVFYFTADGRIDFRELVKDLAHELRTRIEMRQIGVRDEARAVGGVGPCGKELCCATFLRDFEPITVKMAKDQKLSLNPAKLSGVCGRLMCCLIYEHDSYTRQKGCGTCVSTKAPPSAPAPDAAAQPDDAEEMTARLTDDEEGTA